MKERLPTIKKSVNTSFKNPKSEARNPKFTELFRETREKVDTFLGEFRFSDALIAIWEIVHFCDRYIDEKKPWTESPDREEVIGDLLGAIAVIAELLKPFLPETSEKVARQLQAGSSEALFPRLA